MILSIEFSQKFYITSFHKILKVNCRTPLESVGSSSIVYQLGLETVPPQIENCGFIFSKIWTRLTHHISDWSVFVIFWTKHFSVPVAHSILRVRPMPKKCYIDFMAIPVPDGNAPIWDKTSKFSAGRATKSRENGVWEGSVSLPYIWKLLVGLDGVSGGYLVVFPVYGKV